MESAKVVWRDGKFASVCVCGGGGEKNIFLSGVFLSFHPMGHFSQEAVLYAMYSAWKLCTMHKALLLKTVYSELFEVISKLCWGRKTCFCQEFCVLSSDGHFLQEVMLCVMYNACKVCTMREASFIITAYSELFEIIFKLCWEEKCASVISFVSFALMGHLWFKSILCFEAVYNA